MVKAFLRTSAVAFSAVLLTLGLSPAANAANLKVSNGNGYIEHIDSGDRFNVCDTRANGDGVTGIIMFNGTIVAAEDDGGDAGCDSFTFDIKTGLVYELKICDPAYRNCNSKILVE